MRRRHGFITTAWPAIIASAALVVLLVWLLTLGEGSNRPQAGERLVMYCAAGMIKPVQAVADDYRDEFGVEVEIEPAGSGTLLAKIRTTAPTRRGHLYLAADETYIAEARQRAVAAEAMPVAWIRPVIAVAPGNPKAIETIDDLLRDDVRVALANPQLASVGRVTKALLEEAGKWSAIEQRIETGRGVSFVGTVNEAAQAVAVGAADAAIVWDSIAQLAQLESIDAPALRGGEQTITVTLIEPNDRPTATLHFMRYLTAKDRGGERFAEFGFAPIDDADRWAERPEVLLMAGAMLKPAVDEAITRFERREGVAVTRIYNGCGILVSQMKAGKHPDAYFSCDVSYLSAVQEWFDASTIVTRNPMVLLVSKGNPLGLTQLDDLTRDGLTIGFAHPVNSALGALTDRLLRARGLHEGVYDGNNVVHADTGHLIVTQMRLGALDAAIVYRSNAVANRGNLDHYDVVALDDPDAIATQPYAVAQNREHRYLMRRLFEAMTNEATKQRFDELGFEWMLGKAGSP